MNTLTIMNSGIEDIQDSCIECIIKINNKLLKNREELQKKLDFWNQIWLVFIVMVDYDV